MRTISVYPEIKPTSIYLEELKHQDFQLKTFDSIYSSGEEKSSEIVLLDYTEKPSDEVMGLICDQLLQLKETSIQRVIVLVEKSMVLDRMVYLQLGATLVFDQEMITPKEFSLILSNLYQVPSMDSFIETTEQTMEVPIQLDPLSLSVRLETGKEVSLTRLEYKLLNYLKERQGEVCTYEELFSMLWGKDLENNHYRIANLIFMIRNKIESDALPAKYLKTVRTVGYVLHIPNRKERIKK